MATTASVAPNIRLPPKWIEHNLTKRECANFLATTEDPATCQCGRKKVDHSEFVKVHHHQEVWNPAVHSKSFPTDSYGSLVFEGEHVPNKAHFVRLSFDTSPELVLQLMKLVWGNPIPKLLITVQGGSSNFDLSSRQAKIFHTGLIKAAKSCSAWVFTGGFNSGVAKHVGNALLYERVVDPRRRRRVITVGIAPWGVVDHREELMFRNKERVYNPIEHVTSKYRALNSRHSNFILVDNGSIGKMGGERYLRRRLEKAIASYPINPKRGCSIPVVCVVLEGGFYTLRNIGDYLYDDPPIPVVLFDGTGRTASLLSWTIRKTQQLPSDKSINSIKDEVYEQMIKLYHVNSMQCVILFSEVKRILERQNFITIFNPYTHPEDFDAVILSAVFRPQHWSPMQQLSLTLVWDRVDIASSEVFIYGREWAAEHLEAAMMESLIWNRVDFVDLLLEHGLNMQNFLTKHRLEELYNAEQCEILKQFVNDIGRVRPRYSKLVEKQLTLHDVGVAMSHIMGHVYKSEYVRLRHTSSNHFVSSNFGNISEDQLSFSTPFDDLFVWAVLTNRHSLAILFWRHGQGALAKALVAVKITKFLVTKLHSTEETQLSHEISRNVREWENISLELTDLTFKQDQRLTRQLLTMELVQWSNLSCIALAVMGEHRMLLGHASCQMLLADLWMGPLSLKYYPSLKVIFGIIFPPYVFMMDFKSTEELHFVPHPGPIDATDSELIAIGSLNDDISDTVTLRTYDSKSKNAFGTYFERLDEAVHIFEHKSELSSTELRELEESLSTDSAQMEKKAAAVGAITEGFVSRPSQNHLLFGMSKDEPLKDNHSQKSHHRHRFHQTRRPHGLNHQSYVTKKHELPCWKKFFEFQRAPVTNFYRHTIAYIVFVNLLAYLILVPQDPNTVEIYEIFVIAYVASLGIEIIRKFCVIDAINWSQKFVEFKAHVWDTPDFISVIAFMSGVWLRLTPGYFHQGMLIYRITSMYWNLRLYKYMGVHKFLGPKIVMISRMLKHMCYFAMIIFVLIIAFGLSRDAILFPDVSPTPRRIAEIFIEPYIMMFGEIHEDQLPLNCGASEDSTCPVGHWIVPVTWIVYMMVSNILIVNVLIAVFNGIYAEVDAIALEIWMFQRFTFVMDFEEKPLLPPPLTFISHAYYFIALLIRKAKLHLCEEDFHGNKEEEEPRILVPGSDHKIKSYLSATEANIVYDFEEENLSMMKIARTSQAFGAMEDNFIELKFREDSSYVESISKEHQAIQRLQRNFNDFCLELESHRAKLNMLLSKWDSWELNFEKFKNELRNGRLETMSTISSRIDGQQYLVDASKSNKSEE